MIKKITKIILIISAVTVLFGICLSIGSVMGGGNIYNVINNIGNVHYERNDYYYQPYDRRNDADDFFDDFNDFDDFMEYYNDGGGRDEASL